MAEPRQKEDLLRELRALEDGLPFRVLELPEFRTARYDPPRIRQPRIYTRPDDSMLAVGRFLVERGTVELEYGIRSVRVSGRMAPPTAGESRSVAERCATTLAEEEGSLT